MSELDNLKKELSLYKDNGAIGFYYELNRFVNETIEIMRNNRLENLLKPTKDEDAKKFEKIMVLIKNAKEHVNDMKEMKQSLGISGNEEEDKRNKPFVDGIAKTRP